LGDYYIGSAAEVHSHRAAHPVGELVVDARLVRVGVGVGVRVRIRVSVRVRVRLRVSH
jgi:hypothetical protein